MSLFTPDNLIAGSFPLVTHTVVLAPSKGLARGVLLGRITASNQYVLSPTTTIKYPLNVKMNWLLKPGRF